ncbi:hypothetical protein N7532_008375 [Penicillium argentinense]|uniref:Uncharacterized protein n=1 Tax=Penicillium argentinense TaxID=1131581 RepID=A0A9W9EXG9_9EURO|nr:uncharacterized protein N7532_008375 [Penicillium argentinense]KAJ5089691.1 hypothetical protein N7532_008375 [Penicillium argentinense]
MFYFILYLISQTVLLAAWVSGILDPYQKRLQEILLDQMGETKVSYGLKKSLTAKKLTEDENLSKIQDQLGNQLGGIFGKGGIGQGLGSVLNKGL